MAIPKSQLYEESAISVREKKEAKFYTVFKVVSLVFFVVFAGMVVFSFNMILLAFSTEDLTTQDRIVTIVTFVLMDLSALGAALIMWFLKNRFNVSYDYIFVEDEIRLTKVFNGRKRKFIATVRSDQILKIGWVDKPSFDATVRGLNGKKPHVLTPNREPAEGKDFFYLLANGPAGRVLYVLECRTEMIEHLVFVAGRSKLERE